jgi:hypothetical protein
VIEDFKMSQMQTERPKTPTIYVSLTDAHTRERRYYTLYNATLDDAERKHKGDGERRPTRARKVG